jgi:hypothetical protein
MLPTREAPRTLPADLLTGRHENNSLIPRALHGHHVAWPSRICLQCLDSHIPHVPVLPHLLVDSNWQYQCG